MVDPNSFICKRLLSSKSIYLRELRKKTFARSHVVALAPFVKNIKKTTLDALHGPLDRLPSIYTYLRRGGRKPAPKAMLMVFFVSALKYLEVKAVASC